MFAFAHDNRSVAHRDADSSGRCGAAVVFGNLNWWWRGNWWRLDSPAVPHASIFERDS